LARVICRHLSYSYSSGVFDGVFYFKSLVLIWRVCWTRKNSFKN